MKQVLIIIAICFCTAIQAQVPGGTPVVKSEIWVEQATPPTSPSLNEKYLSTDGFYYRWNGTNWQPDVVVVSGGNVDSVNGQEGIVVLTPDNINDASSAKKFITAAQANAITANSAKTSYPAADANKLVTIETNATADLTEAEVDAMVANNGYVTTDNDTQLTQSEVGAYATADGFIKNIPVNSVGSGSIINGSITNSDHADGSISTSKLIDITENTILGRLPSTGTGSISIITPPSLKSMLQYMGSDIPITGYTKPATATAITAFDNINVALGKLEKGLEDVPASSDYISNLAFDGTNLTATAEGGAFVGSVNLSSLSDLVYDNFNILDQDNSGGTAIRSRDNSGTITEQFIEFDVNNNSIHFGVFNGVSTTALTFDGDAEELRIDGVVVGGSGGIIDSNKGDITVSGSGSVWAINDGAITSSKIGGGAILSGNMATNSVNTNAIVNGQVQNADLSGNSVESSNIIDATITNQDLADNTLKVVKLEATNTPSNGQLISYSSATDEVTWVDNSATPVTVGVEYINHTTDFIFTGEHIKSTTTSRKIVNEIRTGAITATLPDGLLSDYVGYIDVQANGGTFITQIADSATDTFTDLNGNTGNQLTITDGEKGVFRRLNNTDELHVICTSCTIDNWSPVYSPNNVYVEASAINEDNTAASVGSWTGSNTWTGTATGLSTGGPAGLSGFNMHHVNTGTTNTHEHLVTTITGLTPNSNYDIQYWYKLTVGLELRSFINAVNTANNVHTTSATDTWTQTPVQTFTSNGSGELRIGVVVNWGTTGAYEYSTSALTVVPNP